MTQKIRAKFRKLGDNKVNWEVQEVMKRVSDAKDKISENRGLGIAKLSL